MKNSKEENKCIWCQRPGATKKKRGKYYHEECWKEAKKFAKKNGFKL